MVNIQLREYVELFYHCTDCDKEIPYHQGVSFKEDMSNQEKCASIVPMWNVHWCDCPNPEEEEE